MLCAFWSPRLTPRPTTSVSAEHAAVVLLLLNKPAGAGSLAPATAMRWTQQRAKRVPPQRRDLDDVCSLQRV